MNVQCESRANESTSTKLPVTVESYVPTRYVNESIFGMRMVRLLGIRKISNIATKTGDSDSRQDYWETYGA